MLFKETPLYKICNYNLNDNNTITITYYPLAEDGKFENSPSRITILNSNDLDEFKINEIVYNAVKSNISDFNLDPNIFVSNLYDRHMSYYILANGDLIHEFLSSTSKDNYIKYLALDAAKDAGYFTTNENKQIIDDAIILYYKTTDPNYKIRFINTCHENSYIMKRISCYDCTIKEKDSRVLAALALYVPKFAYLGTDKMASTDIVAIYEENINLFNIDILVNHVIGFDVTYNELDYLIHLCMNIPIKYSPYKLVSALCIKYEYALHKFADCDIELYKGIALNIECNYTNYDTDDKRSFLYYITTTNDDTIKDFGFYLDIDYYTSSIQKDKKLLDNDMYKMTPNNTYLVTNLANSFDYKINIYKNIVSAYSNNMINILTNAKNRFIKDIGGVEVLAEAYKKEFEEKNKPVEIDLT